MCFVGDRRPAVLTDWNPLTYRLTMEHQAPRQSTRTCSVNSVVPAAVRLLEQENEILRRAAIYLGRGLNPK